MFVELLWFSSSDVLFPLQSLYDRQGVAVVPPTVPGSARGGYLGVPKGTMRRQKSIGKVTATLISHTMS